MSDIRQILSKEAFFLGCHALLDLLLCKNNEELEFYKSCIFLICGIKAI